MKKKLLLMLCVISCLILAAGCSLTRVNEKLDEDTLSKNAEEFVTQWFDYDFSATVEQYGEQMTEYQLESYKGYVKMQKEHGSMDKIVDSGYSLASDTASVTKTVKTEKGGKLVFTVTYDKNGEISDWKVEEYQSIGQIMGRAGLNTVMSMAIVFTVLIFISLIIYCFRFIAAAQDKPKQPAAAGTAVEAPVPAAPAAVEDLTDDLELVAVITAAIAAASETESADGLVVRSIVRRS